MPRIFDNLLYKVVSLLIACVLWAAAQGVTDVEQNLDVSIAVENVPANLVVVEESAHEINLRLVGSRAALRQASKALQRYTVSLEGAKPGEARLAVNKELISLPRGARIAASSPSSLVYQLETLATKSVPVRADLAGELPRGYKLVRVSVDPKEIAVVGAKSSVRNIREVVTDRIELARLRESTELESSVALGYPHVWRKDPDGGPIRVNVEIEPPAASPTNGG